MLRVLPVRVEFSAIEPVHFSSGTAANALRGGLGWTLRRINPNLLETLFRPTNVPRPFVLRTTQIEDVLFAPGNLLSFGIHLFRWGDDLLEGLRRAFSEISRPGMQFVRMEPQSPMTFGFESQKPDANFVRVNFVTPTELKDRQQIASEPSFRALACRARDRISRLSELYGDGPLQIDFREFAERAGTIETTQSKLRHVSRERTSRRTGQTHPIGGFVGWAEYLGNLAEFLPFLDAAQWTGVGRHTVWGNGQIALGE